MKYRNNLSSQERAAIRKAMRELKEQGRDYSHLATSPETYEIYKKVKFAGGGR